MEIVDTIMRYGGHNKRGGDLFGDKSALSFKKFTTQVMKGLQGVSNVYTQHKPLLTNVLQELMAGRLSEREYAYVGGDGGMGGNAGAHPGFVPGLVIVFIIGGVTLEEAAEVNRISRDSVTAAARGKNSGMQSMVGTSAVRVPHKVRSLDEERLSACGATRHERRRCALHTVINC